MKQEFSKYSLERLLEEKSFISWVLKQENNAIWEKHIESDPGFYSRTEQAREIIHLLQDRYKVLDEDSVLEIWKNINQYDPQYQQKYRIMKLRIKFSYAASILVIVLLGIFGYQFWEYKHKGYQFVSTDASQSSEARIVLSTGEEIALKKENSTIKLDNVESQLIVNDSVIVLKEKKSAGTQQIPMNEVVIPFGKKTELLLADGTKVWLNAGSQLAFPSRFTENKREVYLEGEACFKVARNELKPFVVKAGNLEVKVLGTYFNVSAYPADATIETVVLEGSVAVEQSKDFGLGGSEVVLKSSQKASYIKEKSEFTVIDESDVDLYIAWTYGWLKYNRESLWSVLRKVERYYNVEIHLPADYHGGDLITGKLDLKESLNSVMVVLADASGMEYRIIDNIVLFEKRQDEVKRR